MRRPPVERGVRWMFISRERVAGVPERVLAGRGRGGRGAPVLREVVQALSVDPLLRVLRTDFVGQRLGLGQARLEGADVGRRVALVAEGARERALEVVALLVKLPHGLVAVVDGVLRRLARHGLGQAGPELQ